MSKIHQAMQRAEKEASAKGLGSSSSYRTQGPVEHGELTLRTPLHDLVQPGNGTIILNSTTDFNSTTDLSVSLERKTVPNSRLVALSDGVYDGLRDRLRPARNEAQARGNHLKAILITGVGSGDGKSLTAANLSISISRGLGEKVLLVDANLRVPSVHRLLGMSEEVGLSDFLEGTVTASQVISSTDIPNFYVVTSGSRVENPTRLLNTRKMSDFLAVVKKRFDWVFVDAPSLIPEPDADLISSMVDAVILVTRSSQSCASSLRNGIDILKGRNVLGIVLNDVDACEAHLEHLSTNGMFRRVR